MTETSTRNPHGYTPAPLETGQAPDDAQEASTMREAVSAVAVKTHRGDDCRGYTAVEGWEDFDEGLQGLNSERPRDVPGLIDFEYGYAVFEMHSAFGQRALAEGGTSGVAIEGDAVFLVADDPAAARAACLAAAGVDPAAYDLDAPVLFYNWTFFARRD